MAKRHLLDLFALRLGQYADQAGDSHDFIIPEDLSTLSDEALAELHQTAVGHFDALYGDGSALSDADVAALGALTEGIETLLAESTARQEAASARAAQAAELATRVHHEERTETIEDTEDDAAPQAEGEQPAEGEEALPEPVAVAASGRREIRVNLGNLRSRQSHVPAPAPAGPVQSIRDVLIASGDGTGFPAGRGLDWNEVGAIVDRRLAAFNQASYVQASRTGNHLRQQLSVAQIRKPFENDMVVRNGDPLEVDTVLRRAANERRLPGGSLTASGGWCAPSQTVYDLFENESRDGLFSIPEIQVSRGGINFTAGPDFATIYGAVGFDYSEANDVAGNYHVTSGVGDGGSGDKPCYKIPCPSFTDVRLRLNGLCLTAGLLQQRGYPEVIARTVRGALVAHDHKISAAVIAAVVTGSTAVTMAADTLGTTAPLLTSIELQVEHMKYANRLGRGATVEAVFPYWVRGAIRSDLALRTGVELLAVTDAQIDSWFSLRGIAAQFVYDWQPLTGAAGAFVGWPTTVQFLLYPAGTWVKGSSDVITLDTLYDSVLLGTNDFTALFTEEGYLVAKLGHDSRCVTVPVCSSGVTSAPVVLDCDASSGVTDDLVGPVVGTLAASNLANTSFTLTVTGASDAGVGLNAEPYRFSTDGGVTWSEWQTSNVYAVTGKTAGTTYYCRHETRDKNNNVTTGAVITALTTGP